MPNTSISFDRGLLYQIWLPKTFTSTKQLITRRSADNEILCEINAPNTIKPTDKRLSSLLIQTSNYRADKVRSKPLLIQRARNQVGHRGWRDVSFLAQAVHVDFVAEEVGDGGDVGCEACETKVDITVGEDLGEVVADGEGLEAKTEVAGYGNTVFPHHCYAGAAIFIVLASTSGRS